MESLAPYRDIERCKALAKAIEKTVTRPWKLMEVCGGQTHSILRFGIDSLLPRQVELLHGPGCPVCVTPAHVIDQAIALALRPDVILCTYGDMLRVPGERGQDLWSAKAQGGNIKTLMSPLDALTIAKNNPNLKTVFLAIGFETTAPAHAMTVLQAEAHKIDHFYLLYSHVQVPPALAAILERPNNQVQGFLAAGHVCTIMGESAYHDLSAKYRVPIVITGFEPVDLLEGILLLLTQLESGRAEVENQYLRTARPDGNAHARAAMSEVFETAAQEWRGLGMIDDSGLTLRKKYAHRDARILLDSPSQFITAQPTTCLSGQVLTGEIKPPACPHFAKTCHPENPLGATMISAEGTCAAYFHYREQKSNHVV